MSEFDQALADHRAGRLDEALSGYRRVLDTNPDHADACHLLGLSLHQKGENRLAVELLNRALLLSPGVGNYHNSLGLALHGVGDNVGAIRAFQTCATIEPNNADAFNNLGMVLSTQRRFADAESPLRRALVLRPNYPAAQNNLARILVWSGVYDEAVSLLESACAADDRNPDYWNSLGVALREAGKTEDALVAFERALERAPGLIDAHVNRAHIWLLLGDVDQGWPEHEWRLRRPRFAGRMASRCWTGDDIDGRTCLLWAEQGFGDAIQFVRYASLVAARGARVIVECAEPLADLFENVAGVSGTVRPGEDVSFDVHAALMSLPCILGAGPVGRAYIASSAEVLLKDDARYRIGLVWAGSPGHADDRNRSHPLMSFAPLVNVTGSDTAFYGLQMGDAADEASPPAMRLNRIGQAFRNFSDTAAAIAGLDLVITVDTAVAHLAGAMGKPTWVIIPPNPDWRWGLSADETDWYPSMRLFRQNQEEDRSAVFERMGTALGNALPSAQL